MSLPLIMQASEGYSDFNILNKTVEDDGYGGHREYYAIGAAFDGVLVLDNSIEAQRAEKEGVTGLYTLTVEKKYRLPWHTVIAKSGDMSQTYRVTTKDDNSTPDTTALNLRTVNVEEYDITKELNNA